MPQNRDSLRPKPTGVWDRQGAQDRHRGLAGRWVTHLRNCSALWAQGTTLHSCRPGQGTLTTVTCHVREDKGFQGLGSCGGQRPCALHPEPTAWVSHLRWWTSRYQDLAPGSAGPLMLEAWPVRPPSKEEQEEHMREGQGQAGRRAQLGSASLPGQQTACP